MHLACIISLLGPPPLDILHRGKESSRYFDDEGNNPNMRKRKENSNGINVLEQGNSSSLSLFQRVEGLKLWLLTSRKMTGRCF